jgi:hypothetical protein
LLKIKRLIMSEMYYLLTGIGTNWFTH